MKQLNILDDTNYTWVEMIKFDWLTQQIEQYVLLLKDSVDSTVTFYPSCFSFFNSSTAFPNRLGTSDGLSFLAKTKTNMCKKMILSEKKKKKNCLTSCLHYSQHDSTNILTKP